MESTSLTKTDISKAIKQAKDTGKYIGFDLPFILNHATKIDNVLLQNSKVVIIENVVNSLLELRRNRDFRAIYAVNLIDEISKTGKLTVVPETKHPQKFKEYLYEWKLSFKSPLHHLLGYYLKLHDELEFDILILTGDKIDAAVKDNLPLHILATSD